MSYQCASASVGACPAYPQMLGGYCQGQPLGSPKQPGESYLKPAKNKTKAKHTSYLNARTGHDPHCGGPRGRPEWPSRRPPRAGSASLAGSNLPRAGSASLEGSSPPRSRPPHKRTCSRTRTRAFNALTQQSRAITRLGITPRRCSANSLEENHPRHCRELCGMASVSPAHCAAHSRTANAPHPRRGAGCTLEPFPRESAG
jgi:hypothetical protein